MKKILLFIAMIYSLSAKSQSSVYHPFPEADIVWVQQDWYTDFTPVIPCVIYNDKDLYISGDTTIGSFTYHKLYANGHSHCTCPPPNYYYFGQYWGAFRQDSLNRKVYLSINGIDTLAYDFNLNVGDTLPATCLYASENNIVQSIDSILIGNQYHKQFWLTSDLQLAYASLIEGIGTSLGAFPVMAPMFESGNDLFCVKINNQTVWTNPLFPNTVCSLLSINENPKTENKISIDPNPMHNYAVLSVDKKFSNAELKIYDAMGKNVKTQKIINLSATINREGLCNGIYIFKITNTNNEVISRKFIIE